MARGPTLCAVCGAPFDDEDALRDHLWTKHPEMMDETEQKRGK